MKLLEIADDKKKHQENNSIQKSSFEENEIFIFALSLNSVQFMVK